MMSVNLPNPGNYFQQLGNDIVALRDAINALLRDSAYLTAMGGATFLEGAPFNLSAADATAVANLITAVTPTNSTVVAIQNYVNSAVTLTGGQ
jgi:hypothetical protein